MSLSQRRVKCDEAHPTCRRCAKADRTCQGYRDARSISKSPSTPTGQPQPAVLLPSQPTLGEITFCLDSADMIQPFSHYLSHTASYMALTFTTMADASTTLTPGPVDASVASLRVLDVAARAQTLWTTIIPTASQGEVTLQYAVAALSCLHAWLAPSSSSTSTPRPAWQNAAFVRFYSRAVAGVNMSSSANNDSSATATMVLMSYLIFAQCEVLMGAPGNAATHIYSGLSVLNELQSSSPSTDASHGMLTDYIAPVLHAYLTARHSPFPELEFQRSHLNPAANLVPGFPAAFFQSLPDAATALRDVTYRVTLLQQLAGRRPTITDATEQLMATRQLANAWSTMFDRFRSSSSSPAEKQAHLLLLAQHRMLQLLLKTMPPERDERYKSAEGDFRIMLSQLQTFLPQGREVAWEASGDGTDYADDEFLGDSTTGGIGVIMPLFFIATQCPLPDVRAAALDVLGGLRVQEGAWNSCVAHAIGTKAGAMLLQAQHHQRSRGAGAPAWLPLGSREHGYEYSRSATSSGLAPQQWLAVSIDSVERVAGAADKLRVTYHLTTPKGGSPREVYAITELIDGPSACVKICGLEWVSETVSLVSWRSLDVFY